MHIVPNNELYLKPVNSLTNKSGSSIPPIITIYIHFAITNPDYYSTKSETCWASTMVYSIEEAYDHTVIDILLSYIAHLPKYILVISKYDIFPVFSICLTIIIFW